MEKGIENLNRKILRSKSSPTLYRLYRKRGHLQRKMKMYKSALHSFDKAIKLNPRSAENFIQRGIVLSLMKKSIKSVEDYSRAIELNPNQYDFYYNRGREFSHLKLYDKAIRDYSKAIELNPRYSQAYNNRGSAFKHKGRTNEAIKDYQRSIELDRNNDTASMNLRRLLQTIESERKLPSLKVDTLFFGRSFLQSTNDPRRLAQMIQHNQNRMKEIEFKYQESMSLLEEKKRSLQQEQFMKKAGSIMTFADINHVEETFSDQSPPPMMDVENTHVLSPQNKQSDKKEVFLKSETYTDGK